MFESYHSGIVIGVVTDLNDPDGLGRVQVRLPYLNNELSDWAKLVLPMAGRGRGTFFRPEVNDEVLIAYEHGDPRRPYVLGSLWSGVDQPPDGGDPVANNLRFIHSRSGHVLKLDDTPGQERIEIIDKSGRCRIVIDSAADRIQIVADTGNLELSANVGSITLTGRTVELKALEELSVTAGVSLSLASPQVQINP